MSLFDWINLGKHARSPFGKWLDRHGITQQEIAKEVRRKQVDDQPSLPAGAT